MATSGASDWRKLGSCSPEAFAGAIARTVDATRFPKSPMLAEADALYDVLHRAGMTRLAVAMAWMERKNDTWKDDYGLGQLAKNPWAVKRSPEAGGGWKNYATYQRAAVDWVSRLLDSNGPYANAATLKDFLTIYAPPWDGNDVNNYVAVVAREVDALPLLGDAPNPPVVPAKPPAFGNVPYPAVQNRIIPQNTAWDDLGPRANRGVVLHRMIGTLRGTDSYFRGEAAGRALTDYGVGVAGPDNAQDDGAILAWNDPRGRRSPWASGPVSGPYGDGKAFVNKYGSGAVNRDLRSIEISGRRYEDPVTPTAWDAVAKLTAYWADQARIAWDRYPIHPETGLPFTYWHQEFTLGTGKLCPGQVVMDGTDALNERVRAILRAAQGQADQPPQQADPIVVNGLSLSHVRKLFPDFAPGQPVSREYVRYAEETGRTPRLVTVWAGGDGWKKAWEFSDGWYVMLMNTGAVMGSDLA